MPTVRGCNLPDDVLYDVDNHTWFTEVGDGTVRSTTGVPSNTTDSDKSTRPARKTRETR